MSLSSLESVDRFYLAAASLFCYSWCGLCALLVGTWYPFSEAAAGETPVLTVANKKPNEKVKTENNDPIYLKVVEQDGPVMPCKTKWIYHLVN